VVEVSPEERQRVVERYLQNMRAMVEATRAAGAVPVLMTVTTNLEWGGKEDPSGLWLTHAAGGPLPAEGDDRRRALEAALDRQSKAYETEQRPLERWEALFARATLRRALGDLDGAAADFLLAKDTDPRARRCLSAMNDGVRALARELQVPLVDAEARIASEVAGGITGFTHLYDYVHFTPLGAERLAELIDEQLTSSELVPPLGDADFARRRLERLATAERDALDVNEWIGWCDDRAWLDDRDLWKYEGTRKRLDELVEAGTATPVELVWAGNGYALEHGGEGRARELYARARAADPALHDVIDANVAWLDGRAE
jgi:tetratricopeptide (TPR) repeat protein